MLNDKSGKIKHLLGKKPSISSAEGMVTLGGKQSQSNATFENNTSKVALTEPPEELKEGG